MKAIKFTDEEAALLESVRDGRSITQTVIDGLRCLQASQGNMSDEYLMFQLQKRLMKKSSDASKTKTSD